MAAPLVLSTVPPLMLKVPEARPAALLLLRLSVPALRVVPPEWPFAPLSVTEPAVLTTNEPEPEMPFAITILPDAFVPPRVKTRLLKLKLFESCKVSVPALLT